MLEEQSLFRVTESYALEYDEGDQHGTLGAHDPESGVEVGDLLYEVKPKRPSSIPYED